MSAYFQTALTKFNQYDKDNDNVLNQQEFKEFLIDVDRSAKSYPATGKYRYVYNMI